MPKPINMENTLTFHGTIDSLERKPTEIVAKSFSMKARFKKHLLNNDFKKAMSMVKRGIIKFNA